MIAQIIYAKEMQTIQCISNERNVLEVECAHTPTHQPDRSSAEIWQDTNLVGFRTAMIEGLPIRVILDGKPFRATFAEVIRPHRINIHIKEV